MSFLLSFERLMRPRLTGKVKRLSSLPVPPSRTVSRSVRVLRVCSPISTP
jgi:hypothetical protein